jgi:hypothetical protein
MFLFVVSLDDPPSLRELELMVYGWGVLLLSNKTEFN